MIELGKKSEIFGADKLRLLNLSGWPNRMPTLVGKERVICGYNQGLDERMFVCESVEDMQRLYDAYARGGAISICWYIGDDSRFVAVKV